MPRVIITRGALAGLSRCREFLEQKAPAAARRSGEIVADHIGQLERDPLVGRPDEEDPELQELVIPFGATGYVALYRYEPTDGAVYALAFRHQKEAGYQGLK